MVTNPDGAGVIITDEDSGTINVDAVEGADAVIDEYARTSGEVDELITIVDTMDGVANSLVEANEGDSITESTAAALGIAVEHFCHRAGIGKPPVFIKDGFGGLSSRKVSTKIALENIADVIKTVIKKILRWLKHAMTFLYDMMQQLTQGADLLASKARAVAEKAKTIANKTMSEEFITDASFCRFFVKDAKVLSAKEIISAYIEHSKDMNLYFNAGFVKEMSLRANEALEETKQGESRASAEYKVDKIISALKDRSFRLFQNNSSVSSENHEVLTYGLPFGQRSIVVSLLQENRLYSSMGVEVEREAKPAMPDSKSLKLETLTYGQIVELAKAIENEMLFGLFKSYKSSKSELNRMERLIERGCDEITRRQITGNNRGQDSVSFSVHFLKDLASTLVTMTAVVHRYDILVSRRLLDYCALSIKNYS